MCTVCTLRCAVCMKCVVNAGDMMLISQGLSQWFLWGTFHPPFTFICGLRCMLLLLFVSHSKLTRSDINVIISNSWSTMGLHFNFLLLACHSSHELCDCLVSHSTAVTSPNACWEASANSPHSLTSFPCPASHRWRSATRSIPLRSVFSIEPCAVCPLSLAIPLDLYLQTEWPWSSEFVRPTQQ